MKQRERAKVRESKREMENERKREPTVNDIREMKKHMPATSLFGSTNTRKHTVLRALYCACFKFAYTTCSY